LLSRADLSGVLTDNPVYGHEVFGEKFYYATLSVPRLSVCCRAPNQISSALVLPIQRIYAPLYHLVPLEEIHDRGHEIGNHSSKHPHMTKISESRMRQELSDMAEKLTVVAS